MTISYIRLLLDYPCYPVWLYAEDGCVIDTVLPEEWQDDAELDDLFIKLQEAYNALFIDDGKEFSYVGFRSDEERTAFEQLMQSAADALYRKNNGKYTIVNDLHL